MKLYEIYFKEAEEGKRKGVAASLVGAARKAKELVKIGAGIKREPDMTRKDMDDEAQYLRAKFNRWSQMGKFMGRPKF